MGHRSSLQGARSARWTASLLSRWPGASSLAALLDGEALEGLWFDRSREYAARRAGKAFRPHDFTTRESVTLTPVPCWVDLAPTEYAARILEMVEDIEKETTQRHGQAGTQPLGLRRIRRQRPLDRPKKLKKSPAPLSHCATKRVRRMFWEAYSLFYAAYREASEKLKGGDLSAAFPEGSFLPPMPFRPDFAPG